MQTELPTWTRRVLGTGARRGEKQESAEAGSPPSEAAGQPAEESGTAAAEPIAATAAAPSEAAAPEEAPEAAAVRRPTFIEAGCELEGRLVLSSSIELSAEFRGSITCPETVVVGEGADVIASIRARSIAIRGSVVGDVEATREVVIHPTGRLQGRIETPSLVVERGAVFNGDTRMFRPEVEARTRRAEPAAAKPSEPPAAKPSASPTTKRSVPPAD